MLTDEVTDLLHRSVLCWLATSDRDGRPNVSPKELFLPSPPDRVLIADIASPRSVRNIEDNPAVCVAAVDVFDQRGWQVYGRAVLVEPSDADFERLAAPLKEMAGEHFTVKRVISVEVERVSPIIAPSYWARPDLDDDARRASALRAYGVTPA